MIIKREISSCVFAPEAQGKLAGGGAKRNHRLQPGKEARPGGAPDERTAKDLM